MKWSVTAVCAVLALSLLPVSSAQDDAALLTDESGDVALSFYDQSTTMPGGWQAVDLVSLRLTEDRDTISFSLGVAGFPDCTSGTCTNAGDTRTFIGYGEMTYMIQTGTALQDFPYAVFHEMVPDSEFQWATTEQLDVTRNQETLSYDVTIPRELIVDENGSPPRKDTEFTGIYSRSYSQISFGGPDPDRIQEGGQTDMLTTSDQMGIDAPASFPITTGGVDSSGPVTLTSPVPYRASNGGEGTFRFDLQAINTGTSDLLLDLEFEGVPTAWTVERPQGLLLLPPNTPADFSILISTPFGHQHGGTEEFTFRIASLDDPDTWASVDMGLHYVTVPQPSGHHPTMWFHTQPFPAPGNTISNSLGGSNGAVTMSTLEEDEGIQEGPVQGWTGTLSTDDQYHWSVCMTPDLRMGIDMNLTGMGEVELPLQSDRGQSDVTITGRVLHLAGGDPIGGCFSNQYAHRTITEIGTLESTVVSNIGSNANVVTLPITPLEAGDYIAYEPDALLVFEFEANPADLVPGARNPGGPGALNLMPGGLITLPLDEYHDARPAGLVGWSDPDAEPEEPATLDEESFVPTAETKDSPLAPLTLLIAGIAALAVLRRRS